MHRRWSPFAGMLASLALAAPVVLGAAVVAPAGAAQAATAPVVRFGLAQFDSPGRDLPVSAAKLNAEYITVVNTGRTAVALKGWSVADRYGHRFVFGAVTLAPRASVVLHTGSGRASAGHLYWGQENYVWNNTRDTATLRNAKGASVDVCSWTANRRGRVTC